MSDARACRTHGCWKTAYGSHYCGKCLEGNTPEKRGSITVREMLYVPSPYRRKLDKDVMKRRMRAHG